MNLKYSGALMFTFLLLSFLGFADSLYLSATHFFNAVPSCFIAKGCDVVTTSAYSKIVGLPVAFLGVIYYLALIILTLFYLDKRREKVLKILPWVTVLGFATSLWLSYVQIFILKSLCSYCIISALTSTILFAIAMIVSKLRPKAI